MTKIELFVIAIIITFIFYYVVTNIKYLKQNYHFLLEK